MANQNDMGIGTAIGTSALLFQTGHAVFVVQVSDIVYTVRGEKTNHRTKDYSKGLIVGDQLKAAIEGKQVDSPSSRWQESRHVNPDKGTSKAVITFFDLGRF